MWAQRLSARPAALLLALLLAAAACAHGWPAKSDDSPEARLWAWAKAKGAKKRGFGIGRECSTCLRGVVATKDIKAGGTILTVPFTAVLRLKDIDHAAFAAEYARDLLDSMHNDPEFNATWGLFWSTQPGPDGVFTPEVWTDAHLDALQCPELANMGRGQREVTEQVYAGTYPYVAYKPFRETVPEERVSLATFKHVASLLGSRYFGFYRTQGSDTMSSHMVPFVELINHSDDPNAQRSDDGENVIVKALRPIKKGEEITNHYQPGVIHRPDLSLYIYGFVVEKEAPLLAAVDLPGFDVQDPFSPTPADDADHEKGGKHCHRAERERLAARLAGLPTSEAEDRALLDGGSVTDWRHRELLKFRAMRKRALRQVLERMDAAGCAGQDAEGGADAGAAEAAEAPALVLEAEAGAAGEAEQEAAEAAPAGEEEDVYEDEARDEL